MKMIRLFCIVIAAIGLLLGSAAKNFAAATDYPSKGVQVVVAFAPGGTDVNLRPFIEKMAEEVRQPLTFVFKPGAAGAIGATAVATAKPDGYTILGSTQSAMVVLPLTQKTVPFTLESFTPICNLTESYPTLWVQSNSAWKNLGDVVAEAKKKPGKISVTSPGTLAIQHLLLEAFAQEAAIKLNHIPAQGGATVVTALLGGHVDMAVQDIVAGLPHFKSGTLRPLAVFAPRRIKALPDCPTFVELGFKVDTPMIYGLVGPKDTPKEVVEVLSTAARKVNEKEKPYLLERFDKLGAEPRYMPPDEYSANLYKQRDFFAKVVKALTN